MCVCVCVVGAGVDDWTNSIFSHLKFIAAFDLGRLNILFSEFALVCSATNLHLNKLQYT